MCLGPGKLPAKRQAPCYRRFAIVTLLSALLLSLALPIHAQDIQQQVIVEVLGTSCPFCAFGLEKRFDQIEGVADVKIDLKGGRAILTLQRGARISEEALRQAVDDAGFTPGKIIYRSGAEREKAG